MDSNLKLQNQFLRAEINLFGAELIFVGTEKTGNVLWSKQTGHWNRIAPNLFPIVGRLVNDNYMFQGKSYHMTQHGFARDREFEVVEQTENLVRLRLKSDTQSMDLYPFSFIFDVCYSLTENGITISYETQNTGNEPMYYSVGGHPAFDLQEPLENYYLEFDSAIQLERQELSGGYFSGETAYYGVSNHLNLGDELFESDAFVLKTPQCQSVSLKHTDGKTLVQMSCDSWTGIGFWTKKDAPFICIEPWWGWADHADTNGNLEEKKGIIQVEAGMSDRKNYRIEIPMIPGM
ncbi:aldose 1-epimerase family protein [Fluviicola chungangensis]|uniref:Aldose 1-epimerase family protein n=1 Tax=Fluviicola chungangensis TaxID=2597671 RepID=A0A556MZS3_9FLAO|nr:aldose 1-epimerase family protein [Fluviicola chungangensis]TSJ45414.1 aldose 1-epimerase family protein [Fluviicola chungangensis]